VLQKAATRAIGDNRRLLPSSRSCASHLTAENRSTTAPLEPFFATFIFGITVVASHSQGRLGAKISLAGAIVGYLKNFIAFGFSAKE